MNAPLRRARQIFYRGSILEQHEKKIIKLTTSSHALVHLLEGVIPPLIPLLMLEFSTDYFHMGLVVTVLSYAFGFGSLPAGFVVDRIGPRRLITAYLFGTGAASLLVIGAGSLITYGILMGLVGLFCSPYHPASNALISVGIKEKGRVFGIHGIAGSLGVAVVPVVSAWIGTYAGWRGPHILYGIIGLGLGFYSLTIRRQKTEKKTGADKPKEKGAEQKISLLNLIFFFISAMALGLTYKGIMTFLPAYMGENVTWAGMSVNKVTLGGTVTTLALLSGAVGQYIAGRLVDRISAERLYLLSIAVGTICVFIMSVSTNVMLIAAAVVYAFFYFSTQPIQNYLLSRYFPPHRQGMGYGIHFFITFGIGSTAAAVSGYLADQFGLRSVFYFMGMCFILSCVASWILLARTREK